MTSHIPAIFEHGAFVPQSPCDIPEGTLVNHLVEIPLPGPELQAQARPASKVTPPLEPDPEERRRILAEVVRSMRANPIPSDAPRFTREELHERR
jgi:hypothetical protein